MDTHYWLRFIFLIDLNLDSNSKPMLGNCDLYLAVSSSAFRKDTPDYKWAKRRPNLGQNICEMSRYIFAGFVMNYKTTSYFLYKQKQLLQLILKLKSKCNQILSEKERRGDTESSSSRRLLLWFCSSTRWIHSTWWQHGLHVPGNPHSQRTHLP